MWYDVREFSTENKVSIKQIQLKSVIIYYRSVRKVLVEWTESARLSVTADELA